MTTKTKTKKYWKTKTKLKLKNKSKRKSHCSEQRRGGAVPLQLLFRGSCDVTKNLPFIRPMLLQVSTTIAK